MRVMLALLLLLTGLSWLGPPARARDEPGRFDYWVLALSWSPAWCGESPPRASAEQCTARMGFVVHGLWPQHERGYPAACRRPEPIPEAVIGAMLPLMPSRALIEHQWRKHGTCAGPGPEAYFATVARARQRVAVPDFFADAGWRRVERLFVAANPGLAPEMVAVVCKGGVATEIRVCLDRDLDFRACGKDVRDRCGDDAQFPPARGHN